MNNKFDELAKGLAQSVTRRGALKTFGVGIAGVVLATLGLANKAQAEAKVLRECGGCISPYFGCDPSDSACVYACYLRCKHRFDTPH